MMKRLTLDTSVFIAAIRATEEKHELCKKLVQSIGGGGYEVIEPYTVLVEIGAAVKRRFGSSDAAKAAVDNLLLFEAISFEELVKYRAEEAVQIAAQNGLRGMDAVVVQIAKENNCFLVTLDKEMAEKAGKMVAVLAVEELA